MMEAILKSGTKLQAVLSQAPMIINDWVITVEAIEGGKRLIARRGSEEQVMDIMDGVQGEKGDTGKSAYQYAKDGGYAGTEAEFTAKLAAEWQNKLTGTAGQVVGFDANGNAVAQEAPSGGGMPSFEETIDLLIETDMLAAVTDADNAILADENNNILLW